MMDEKTKLPCCNTFPKFVDDEATKLGFDGAASCRKREYLGRRARVTPGPTRSQPSPTSVDVLCVDTRADPKIRTIELGFKAAQKAYGRSLIKDENAKVCIGDSKEVELCNFETDCDETIKPDEADCIPKSCTKQAGLFSKIAETASSLAKTALEHLLKRSPTPER